MRAVLPTGLAALALAFPAAAADWHPGRGWLAQAQCIHLKEAAWTANTGNGYFGGMQFMAATWRHVGGKADPAFAHPGDPAYPFSATPAEQLYRAWRLWRRDHGTWRSWGSVGASCSSPRPRNAGT
ncbi:MAG TPA: transglycosylase family protein [Gaiellaceae bacterium]|nr:transglycosylase family protein [Gaiellaceae bacterium]